MPLLCRDLSRVQWNSPAELTGPNVFETFFSSFMYEFNKVFPAKLVCGGKIKGYRSAPTVSDKSWYTPELRRMKNFVILINDHVKSANSPNEQNRLYKSYIRANKLYRSKVSEAKKAYNVTKIEQSPNTCKAAWEVINKARPLKPKVGCTASPDSFNEFFINTVEEIVNELPMVAQDPLNITVRTNDYEPRPTLNQWKEVLPTEVIKIVKNFKASSSPDIYGVSCKILKAVIDDIAAPFCVAINTCLREGVFPDSLKIARTVPIHKKGNIEELANYRPISVLPIMSKVLETVVKVQLTNFFEVHSLLNDAQHGFRRGRSTTTALLSLASKITDAFEDGDSLALTLCDLSKAFDCVPHNILLKKLEMYGVQGIAHKTLTSYLVNRKQVVSIAGATSKSRNVAHGVPQGSVLGPLLFLILVNDLSLGSRALLFADDTTLITRGRLQNTILRDADDLLSAAAIWFTANKLKLNEDKTQQILCTLKQDAPEIRQEAVKLLGFWLDPKLNWDSHVSGICTRLSRVIFLLRKLRHVITDKYLITAYHSLFHSHLSYGVLLWGHSAACKRVLLLQKKAIRIIASVGHIEHCRPIFQRLGILTVYGQYVFNCLLHIKENCEGYKKRLDIHRYNTRGAGNLNIPQCRLTKSQKCFPVSGIKLFNSLPEKIRDLDVKAFRNVIHAGLINRPIYSINELEAEPLF